MEVSKKIVKALIKDIGDRRGLKSEWANIDADVKAEIRAAWQAIIEREIGSKKKTKAAMGTTIKLVCTECVACTAMKAITRM